MDAQDIIIRPIITEKSMNGAAMKKYTFEVAKNAEKIQIKKAPSPAGKGAEKDRTSLFAEPLPGVEDAADGGVIPEDGKFVPRLEHRCGCGGLGLGAL